VRLVGLGLVASAIVALGAVERGVVERGVVAFEAEAAFEVAGLVLVPRGCALALDPKSSTNAAASSARIRLARRIH
jgi:hypothetical protein